MPGSARDAASPGSLRVNRRRDFSAARVNAAKVVNEAARVAQSVEHTLGKGEVIGSIPIASLYYNESQLRQK